MCVYMYNITLILYPIREQTQVITVEIMQTVRSRTSLYLNYSFINKSFSYYPITTSLLFHYYLTTTSLLPPYYYLTTTTSDQFHYYCSTTIIYYLTITPHQPHNCLTTTPTIDPLLPYNCLTNTPTITPTITPQLPYIISLLSHYYIALPHYYSPTPTPSTPPHPHYTVYIGYLHLH